MPGEIQTKYLGDKGEETLLVVMGEHGATTNRNNEHSMRS